MHALHVQADDTALAAAYLAAAFPDGRAVASSAAMTVRTCRQVWLQIWGGEGAHDEAMRSRVQESRQGADLAVIMSTHQGYESDGTHD